MATISKLLQTLSFMTFFLMLPNHLVLSQGVSFNYTSFSQNTVGLIYQGGAHVPQGSPVLSLIETDSSGLPLRENVGRVVYSQPIVFWTPPRPAMQLAFYTTIKFRITPSQNGAADGLTFFIAPVNTTIPSGATGGNLGIFSSDGTTPNLFAVEFDNFVNSWDPDNRHIGIDIESRTSRTNRTFDSATGELVTARIVYDPRARIIIVSAGTESYQPIILRYIIDLKTILPMDVLVGISAATGQTVARHDVISWSFTSGLELDNFNTNEEAYIQKY